MMLLSLVSAQGDRSFKKARGKGDDGTHQEKGVPERRIEIGYPKTVPVQFFT